MTSLKKSLKKKDEVKLKEIATQTTIKKIERKRPENKKLFGFPLSVHVFVFATGCQRFASY